MLRTRGKRVVAEATLPRDLIAELMPANVDLLCRARLVSNLGVSAEPALKTPPPRRRYLLALRAG